ncbi:MAG: hypothetical protein AB7F89_15965 [Pirellulaceae bacterium]
MTDYEVQRCTRRCAKSDRDLRAGEAYVSVLVPDGTQIKRFDYSLEAWDQPPENAMAWWKSRMPGGGGNRHAAWAPHDVMLDFFLRLEGDTANEDVRYVLALLMIRRRILRLEHTEPTESGDELLVLFCARNDTEYRVRAVVPSDARATEIQTRLTELLVTPAA